MASSEIPIITFDAARATGLILRASLEIRRNFEMEPSSEHRWLMWLYQRRHTGLPFFSLALAFLVSRRPAMMDWVTSRLF